MSKDKADELKYERVSLAGIRKGRRGKHHELVTGILEDLETLPSGSALKIPVADCEGVSVNELRAAVSRATKSRQTHAKTHFDGRYFYVWKAKLRV